MRVCQRCGWAIKEVAWTWYDTYGFDTCQDDEPHLPANRVTKDTEKKLQKDLQSA